MSNQHAAELRRLIKRREAISAVSPYLVAVVGYAQTWLYENGVLCYICDRELRILDLHRSASSEMAVCIRSLLNEALPESQSSTKYKFRLLYCSDDIISCVYTHQMPRRMSWLVVFNAKKQHILTVHRLSTTSKMFVRNNDKFLYYGTYSETGTHASRSWILKAYDIKADKWVDGSLILTDFLGSEIGTTVCFEILGDHFYGLSNRLDPAVEERDWISYYTCCRFSLGPKGFQTLDYVPQERLWRRQHKDGPIDERWSFLKLFKDETTSQLKILEARKEWLSGQSSAKRSYYTTEVSFGDAMTEGGPSSIASYPVLENGQDQPTPSKDSQSTSKGPPSRDPHMVHVGDDAAKCVMFTSSKCPLRSYHSSSQAFMDLVDDPTSSNPDKQRIRVRGSSRRCWTPGELEQRKRLPKTETELSQHTLIQRIEDVYKHEHVVLWPPDEDPARPDPALSQLYEVLNPPSHVGNIHGVWDERSLVYATGGGGTPDPLKALVFISWDPAIYLDGIMQYPNLPPLTPAASEAEAKGDLGLPAPGLYNVRRKRRDDNPWYLNLEPNVTHDSDTNKGSDTTSAHWRKFEPPKYRTDRPSGYHFAR